MTGDREALLELSIRERLLDGQRHLNALEHAAVELGDDFDLDAFETAWGSNDPDELTRAYAIQAGYENVINACIKVAQELCRLEGWSDPRVEPLSIEALKLLHEHGVINAKTRSALKDAQERRSDVQHDYVNVAAREIHEAARHVMEHAPLLFQDVAGQLRQRR
ncbi:MAG: HepT-like ribonuclease domain-containing protein [Gaiellaceae bacterium]|jgi:uncharacterized protein YutE (UPF0331/DUF86 family)